MKFLRGTLSAVIGLLVGGASGYGLSLALILTPAEQVLGPRFSEFDYFGVIGVTCAAALLATVAAGLAGAGSDAKLRATFTGRNLLLVVLLPTVVTIILTFAVSREWAWFVPVHLATCLGLLAGAGAAWGVTPAAHSTEAGSVASERATKQHNVE